jgi:L-iditol 2-dehydrogenase
MKVAKLYSFNDIRIEEIPIPECGPKDALIETKACGICSGDAMPWYIEKKAPLVLGHEPVGKIVNLGKDLPTNLEFKIGDKVFIHHHAPCMNCRYCKRGDYVQCPTWKKTRITPGGISEYILVPEVNLHNDILLLPEDLSYEDGTLIEPTACVIKSLKRSNIRKGDIVLVIGLGVMGQMHIILSKYFGAEKVIGADLVDFRLNKALEFGADYVINVLKDNLQNKIKELTDGYMANVVIVNPNSINALKEGLNCLSSGGTILLFTPVKPDELLTIDPNTFYFKDINIITSYSCGPDDTKEALGYIKNGIISAKKIVTHRFKIEETEKAYRITAEAKDSLKCLIVF